MIPTTLTHKKTILVLEDEQPLLLAIEVKLRQSGFTVISARSVDQAFNAPLAKKGSGALTTRRIEAALKYLEDLEHVDAIWLDHSLLGDEDGLDFVKKFKANGGRWSKIPIFVVSNNENDKTMQSYLHAGVNKYYIKSNHRLDEIVRDLEITLSHITSRESKKKRV